MTSAKDLEAPGSNAAYGAVEMEDELDPATDSEPVTIPIRVDPLPQQNASPADVDKGLHLLQLCRDGTHDAIVASVNEGSPAGFISKTGWTPIAAAAFSGKTETVSYLLEIGADAMYKTSRRSNATTATSQTLESGLLLPQHSHGGPNDLHVSSNSSASKSSSKVNTPLHWASYAGQLDVLAVLLRAGYSIEDADPIGNRCLHLACSGGHRDVVELLLAHSASVDQRNEFGNRPVDLATDMRCRKLLLKFAHQTTCEWCKEAFTRIRRPSLCQQCHNIYCDARPCSSYLESSMAVGSSSSSASSTTSATGLRVMRFCQECASEMGKAEQELRSLLDAKLELIRRTLSALGSAPSTSDVRSISRTGSSRSNIATDSDTTGARPSSSTAVPGNSSTGNEPLASDADDALSATANTSETPGTLNTESGAATASSDAAAIETSDVALQLSARPTTSASESTGTLTTQRRCVTSDDMARALVLSQTDAEALYTAIEAAQAKAADEALVQRAKRTYHQLVAHVALQEEIKALLIVRPIGVRSLVAPLKRALQLAQREAVSDAMLELAVQIIQSAEAECTLFGCHALCAAIVLGSKQHARDIARLDASLAEAQQLGASDSLLAAATALRDRLHAEVALERCLVPFTATPIVAADTGVETMSYVFSDGAVASSLLQALELRSQQIAVAVEVGASVANVSSSLLEDGANALKQLKKDIRDEVKNEDERRRLEEEAAAKAAKKKKPVKKKKA